MPRGGGRKRPRGPIDGEYRTRFFLAIPKSPGIMIAAMRQGTYMKAGSNLNALVRRESHIKGSKYGDRLRRFDGYIRCDSLGHGRDMIEAINEESFRESGEPYFRKDVEWVMKTAARLFPGNRRMSAKQIHDDVIWTFN